MGLYMRLMKEKFQLKGGGRERGGRNTASDNI